MEASRYLAIFYRSSVYLETDGYLAIFYLSDLRRRLLFQLADVRTETLEIVSFSRNQHFLLCSVCTFLECKVRKRSVVKIQNIWIFGRKFVHKSASNV